MLSYREFSFQALPDDQAGSVVLMMRLLPVADEPAPNSEPAD
ncbi:MAG: hypothetical protein ACREM6_13635 [Vulcanimicrobiaceae bacterium]